MPQRDGICALGQAITLIMTNVVSCAFYDVRSTCDGSNAVVELPIQQLIAVMSVTREQLDFGVWKVIGHQQIVLDRELWPNEEFRERRWVGARIYDAAIAESLLDAFYGLIPWDAWKDPLYLDKLLAYPGRRPKHVLLTKPR